MKQHLALLVRWSYCRRTGGLKAQRCLFNVTWRNDIYNSKKIIHLSLSGFNSAGEGNVDRRVEHSSTSLGFSGAAMIQRSRTL